MNPTLARRAHWIRRDTILWNPRVDGVAFHDLQVELLLFMDGGWPGEGTVEHGSANGGGSADSKSGPGRPSNVDSDPGHGSEPAPQPAGTPVATLTLVENGADEETRARFPHLASLAAWKLSDWRKEWLRGQLVVRATLKTNDAVSDSTGVQIAGVLDDLFTYRGPLGLHWSDDRPLLYLWAPTAQQVSLRVFDGPDGAPESGRSIPMYRGLPPEDGTKPVELGRRSDSPFQKLVGEPGWDAVWAVEGDPSWRNQYFVLEVKVYAPETGRVETNFVTDPYSRSLSTDSMKSQFVDLNDEDLAPAGWRDHRSPQLDSFHDIVLYELHVRDFSARDESTPEDLRGTFLAFTADSVPTRHLRSLAQAGVTHLHLLPIFDIATIPADRSSWPATASFENIAPDSEEPQKRLERHRHTDGFNWGYDPFHYGVPEGSYCLDPSGRSRVLECRRMVDAVHGMGLRVILDVVYNHSYAAGQDEQSVLDRIVPGYYYRLDADGETETSTCCPNIASEHAMVERLIGDDLEHWARHFKVDGFRFDLMGHHMKHNVERWRDRLRALRVETDGVDGEQLFLYGEGWDFGEVQGGARGPNATQWNMAGTGVGTFNDRLRDALRGGGVTGDIREPGFITGLHVDPGFRWTEDAAQERAVLLAHMDKIRSGLAGNLADFSFIDRDGETRPSRESAHAYASSPLESIQYVSAHDNETLFDKVLLSSPEGADRTDRLRMHRLGLAAIALAQGVPFFHAGSEILRSKSLDRDSYDSGDWFNRLDFTMKWHAFGRGLPPAEKNEPNWELQRPLLQRTDLRPNEDEMRETRDYFFTLLEIRRSSPLFRLRSLDDVQRRVKFHNTGPDAIAGLVAMSLSDEEDKVLDSKRKGMVVLFNSCPAPLEFTLSRLVGRELEIEPRLLAADRALKDASFDGGTGAFHVSGRSTTIFFEAR